MKALFLGRFQPFHKGHLKVIQKMREDGYEILVGIGSAQESDTEYNPYSHEQRREMIEAVVPDAKISFIDDINSDERYVKHVEKIVGCFDAFYGGTKKTSRLFSEAGYKIVDLGRIDDISGTEIRKRIKNNEDWKSLVPEAIIRLI